MMATPSARQIAVIKVFVFCLCLAPTVFLAWGVWQDTLGANPIEVVTRELGTWALRFLILTLTITPARKWLNWNWLLRMRRMLGLYAFFYGVLHLITYLWLDQFFDWMAIGKDIIKRPFITVGFLAFVLMTPLAITSTNKMVKRLGGQRWLQLHRAVYAVAIFAVVHYWWMVKKDITHPLIYAILLGILLSVRIAWRKRKAQKPVESLIQTATYTKPGSR